VLFGDWNFWETIRARARKSSMAGFHIFSLGGVFADHVDVIK